MIFPAGRMPHPACCLTGLPSRRARRRWARATRRRRACSARVRVPLPPVRRGTGTEIVNRSRGRGELGENLSMDHATRLENGMTAISSIDTKRCSCEGLGCPEGRVGISP